MLKLSAKIYALHGFLGLPTDWEGYEVERVAIGTADSPLEWARAFNAQIRHEKPARRFLMGYSMGGRLALHALIESPDLWEKGIILSAHPGLTSGKEERIAADELWARRFENDPWDEVITAWMAQPVFKGSGSSIRLERDFNRATLASHLRNFSLGRQEKIASPKALWFVGERDEKFRSLLPEATVVPNAGHRVIFDNPDFIKKVANSLVMG